MKRISDEDFDAWKHNPITLAVFAHLKQMKAVGEQMWVSKLREEIDPDPRKVHVTQIELKAKLELIEDMLDIELKDIQEDEQGSSAQVAPIRAAKRR